VVLVGHSGTGKSSLVEALLAATGTIQRPGSIEEGTTVSDFDETEVRQQRSVNLTLAPIIHNGIKVNLLDTPGYADFTGDLRAGLRAADSALFAVSATDGIDGVTRMLWEECAAVGMPRAGRHHQDRPPAGRVPGDAGRVPRGLRRRRGAAVPAGRRARHRADRAAVAEAVQLLRRRALRGRARGRGRGAHDRACAAS
jgi:small GTP-binding protein